MRFVPGLVFLSTVSVAVAAPIKLTLSGAITASNMTAFGVGQQATVSLVYESTTSYQSLFNQQAFYVNALTSVSFTSGSYSGSDTTGPFGWTNVYNNLPVWWQSDPYDGISFVVASNPGHYTFTSGANTVEMPNVFSNSVSQSFDAIRVNLEANYSTALSGWALPETLDLSSFTNRNMLFGFSGGSFMTGISSIQVENLAPGGQNQNPSGVPDTGSTGLLAAMAFTGLIALRRRLRS